MRDVMSHFSPSRCGEHRPHFVAGEDDRQRPGLAGADQIAELTDLLPDHVTVEEEQCG
jgi:hypothetical protein